MTDSVRSCVRCGHDASICPICKGAGEVVVRDERSYARRDRLLDPPSVFDTPVWCEHWAQRKTFLAACDAAGIERATSNRDMRQSFASMLIAGGYGAEYIRHALGHLGPVKTEDGRYAGATKSTIATQHYMRITDDLIRRELRRRREELG